jgi:hypothetical protein
MGMFDEIRVELLLPKEYEITDTWYQTKSLECALYKYVITAKGELYREGWDYEWVTDANSPLTGNFKKIADSYYREYLTDFTGDIIFYRRVWRDYHARFTNGKLERLWYEDKQY